ncbi:MAG TPA: GGDEF domain-containing protein [Gemmatimonadales bacterium]|nr:GGDEF domain-containing protein [Gemmatimonadales bacterium]
MKAAVVWVGRGLAVLGLATVLLAVLQAPVWALLAAAGGFVAATGLALVPVVRVWLADQPATRPSDIAHLLELLRRAYAGRAAWAVGLPDGDVEDVGRDPVGREVRRRGAAIVQLASIDGRAHVARESEGTYVAVGDFPFGAGVLLAPGDAGRPSAEEVVEQLRRLVAGMRVSELPLRGEPAQLVAKQLAAIASGAQTLEGVARAGVELAQQLTERGAVIALAGVGPAQSLHVLAVSTAADMRLVGHAVPDGAPAARAMNAGVPVVSHGDEDVFGIQLSDRRRRDRAGTAYPLHDGNFAIGVLVITGPPIDSDSIDAEQVQRLVAELGGRLAAARALHEAERRAVIDQLTGLPNRREFERQRSRKQAAPVTLIFLDLDRFKVLNDTLGHAAGDAALRHVAGLLQAAIRDQDIAARIGGEEFAVWMPQTPLAEGMEVAERIRRAVETTQWRWDGTPRPLTLSCGVATCPDSVAEAANLPSAADAALYRAKQAGRNRVEKATPRP